MPNALRSVIAVVAGFVLASAVMMVIEFINGHVLHPDLGTAAAGMTNPDAIRDLLASAPVSVFAVVLIGWLLGSVAGGWVTARIAPTSKINHALVLGVLLTLAGIANNLMIPPPLWFWIVGLLVLVPGAWVGGRFATR